MASVRFRSAKSPGPSASSSSASKECQTLPVRFASIGTDAMAAPERGTQTDPLALLALNTQMAKSARISAQLVETVMAEMERARQEDAILAAYERRICGADLGIGGIDTTARVSLRHIRSVEVPAAAMVDNLTCLLSLHFAHHRVAMLFGSPQHEANWCQGHLGAQLVVVELGTRRGKQASRQIPLPACPSAVLFARQGELIIVGTHNGDLLLLASAGGDLLWRSASTGSHARAVSQLRWMVDTDGGGGGEPKELISVGLDGALKRNRLAPNNRLELLRSVAFTVADLPRELRRGATAGTTALGLVDFAIAGDNLLIATDIGVLLELDQRELGLLGAFALADSAQGVEQIALIRSAASDQPDRLVWRASDGLIWHRPYGGGGTATTTAPADARLVPMPARTHTDFQIFDNLLISIGEPLEGGRHELQGVDLRTAQFAFRKSVPDPEGEAEGTGRVPEGIVRAGRDTVVVAMRRRNPGGEEGMMELEMYQIVWEAEAEE